MVIVKRQKKTDFLASSSWSHWEWMDHSEFFFLSTSSTHSTYHPHNIFLHQKKKFNNGGKQSHIVTVKEKHVGREKNKQAVKVF